jgi:hypothetical protein
MGRIHILGGEPTVHHAVRRGDPAAVAAMLATINPGVLDPRLMRMPPLPFGGYHGQASRFSVGVDMYNLPNADGSAPKVEWLPLSAAAGNDIVAAATRDYELKPNKYARPGPLVMADTLAVNLVMTALQIGGKPVFAGSGAVPCVLFSHLSISNALSSYVASNNAPITFTLQNIHASVTQTVRGVWVCDTSELAVS